MISFFFSNKQFVFGASTAQNIIANTTVTTTTKPTAAATKILDPPLFHQGPQYTISKLKQTWVIITVKALN